METEFKPAEWFINIQVWDRSIASEYDGEPILVRGVPVHKSQFPSWIAGLEDFVKRQHRLNEPT